MVMAGLLLAAAMQAQTAGLGTLRCSLADAAGDVIAFGVRAENADSLSLIPMAESPWPTQAIAGARAAGVQPETFARNAFAFGDARHGVLLHLGGAPNGQDGRVATLYSRDGAYAALPLAYGFCRQAALVTSSSLGPTNATVGPVDVASFDSARWRDGHCALVTLSGLHTRFRFTPKDPEAVEFAAEDPAFWGGAPITVAHHVVRQLDGHSPGAATLRTDSGLDGVELTFVQTDPARVIELMQFHRLGGAGPAATEPAVAICGHSFPARRHRS
jgi:hypothetical protein